MRQSLIAPCALLFASFVGVAVERSLPQDKAAEHKMTPEDAAKKNPIAASPESIAEARKLYGYDCAMCHGKEGDGKGDLATDMKLEMHDWRDAASLEKMTDGEVFFIITNGKGKMEGEGDRSSERARWNLVNYVRALAKKGGADKPKPENPQP